MEKLNWRTAWKLSTFVSFYSRRTSKKHTKGVSVPYCKERSRFPNITPGERKDLLGVLFVLMILVLVCIMAGSLLCFFRDMM